MGNRAVIAIGEYADDSIGIYVHWNGGRDSVEGFLLAAREVMVGREGDKPYSTARLIQCIGNFFNGNLSFGVDFCKNLHCDNGDNGVYVVDPETLEITGRFHAPSSEQCCHNPSDIARRILHKTNRK